MSSDLNLTTEQAIDDSIKVYKFLYELEKEAFKHREDSIKSLKDLDNEYAKEALASINVNHEVSKFKIKEYEKFIKQLELIKSVFVNSVVDELLNEHRPNVENAEEIADESDDVDKLFQGHIHPGIENETFDDDIELDSPDIRTKSLDVFCNSGFERKNRK